MTHIEDDIPFRKRSISVTFDDGYRNTFTHAYPILKQLSIPATIFLTTGYIGTNKLTWWQETELLLQSSQDTFTFDEPWISGTYNLSNSNDKQKLYNTIRQAILHPDIHDPDEILKPIRNRITVTQCTKNPTFLSWDEILEMAKNPLIEFGSHTVSHKILSKMSRIELLPELAHSKMDIEQNLGTEVDFFAYPNGQIGDFTEESQYCLKEAGYRCAVTTTHGSINISSNPYQLNRMSISGKDSWPMFVSKLSGIDNLLRLITRKFFKKG
jgi:peptidoglycan/xylan/chitin deacetylase (PgdA/CDA1 family)